MQIKYLNNNINSGQIIMYTLTTVSQKYALFSGHNHTLFELIFSNTRNVAFKNSKHCENKDEMRYEKASALKEAALFAVDMIEKWSL